MSDLRARWREAAAAIGRRPSEGWRDRLVHHGFRVVAVAAIAVLVPVLFPRAPLPDIALLEEGVVAPEDVIAQIGFSVPKPYDQLEAERREAERAVTPIFTLDPAAADSAVRRVHGFFVALDSALEVGGEAGPEELREFLAGWSVPADPAQLAWLRAPGNRDRLEDALAAAYRRALPRGVVRGSDLAEVRAPRILVRGPGSDRLLDRDSVRTAGQFFEAAAQGAPAGAGAPGIGLFQTLLVRFHEPSLRPDPGATQEARRQARAVVDTVAGYVLEGERIVSAHERVTRREIERLRAYQEALVETGLVGGGRSALLRAAGAALYAALLLAVLAVVLRLYRPTVYRQTAGFLIVMTLVLLVLAGGSAVARAEAPAALIPIAFLAVLLGALYDGLLGLVAAAVTAVILGGQPPFSGIGVPFLLVSAGAAAALGVRAVRRRTHSWTLIAGITGAYVLAAAALAAMRSLPATEVATAAVWGGVSATLCTVLAIQAVLPGLEKLTGITTDQTLLELSDLNAPLLRELSRRAPGTYAHSINVANLAESACGAIGVSPLAVRVGAYYHDIGKMLRPEYFVENQPPGRNPHDHLPPARSARIIREHVTEGLRLAAEHRLPPLIRDFIREHHGTQRISYFYDRARQQSPGGEIDPAGFAYPGPRPQSRASGVLMLADSVESSCRVLRDPTPESIRALIERVVGLKLEEGQLDQAPLTRRDLELIKSHFARVLEGLYHRRIEYPSGIGAEEPAVPLTSGETPRAARTSTPAEGVPSAGVPAGANAPDRAPPDLA